jgi:uncharacterized damage-inducible protein DinB
MTKLMDLITTWKEVREGAIDELARIPDGKMDFRATAETRSILEIAYHIIESERGLVREICREDSDIRRVFASSSHGEVNARTSEALGETMRASLEASAGLILQFGEDNLEQTMMGFQGKEISKFSMLTLLVGHEMYHRGQITVYQRLLGIEPALTERFRNLTDQ